MVRVPFQASDSPDQLPCKVLHWGGGKKESAGLRTAQNSNLLVELGTKQIVASDKHRLVLTVHGSVYSLKAKGSEEYSAMVSLPPSLSYCIRWYS